MKIELNLSINESDLDKALRLFEYDNVSIDEVISDFLFHLTTHYTIAESQLAKEYYQRCNYDLR